MKIKLDKIKNFLRKISKILTKKPFLTLMALIVVAFILGGIIFYKFCYLISKVELQIIERPFSFKEDIFKDILKEWAEREKNIAEIEFKEYPNPFQRSLPEELTD